MEINIPLEYLPAMLLFIGSIIYCRKRVSFAGALLAAGIALALGSPAMAYIWLLLTGEQVWQPVIVYYLVLLGHTVFGLGFIMAASKVAPESKGNDTDPVPVAAESAGQPK